MAVVGCAEYSAQGMSLSDIKKKITQVTERGSLARQPRWRGGGVGTRARARPKDVCVCVCAAAIPLCAVCRTCPFYRPFDCPCYRRCYRTWYRTCYRLLRFESVYGCDGRRRDAVRARLPPWTGGCVVRPPSVPNVRWARLLGQGTYGTWPTAARTRMRKSPMTLNPKQ
jgi:hypothetical protein